MTNKEALKAIERFRSLAHGHAVLAEALDMAIKALSAQPEQNCVLTVWGECSYAETGCSECQIKAKITTALSCSESPNKSDTIYRQDAMDALAKFVPYAICDESTESYTNGLTDAYNLICQLPSAQSENVIHITGSRKFIPEFDFDENEPKRNRGKWIRITQGAIPEKYMCPFCHRTVEHEGVEHFVSMMYPFCHCGADMRGKEE